MTEGDAIDIVQDALWAAFVAAGPAVAVAMAIGVAIALLQALTQVQEMTLTFVPKIVGVGVALGIAAPFMGARLNLLTELALNRIENGF